MSEHLQYVARIFVPTTGDKGNNGTAYPIAPNRVITAAHMLNGWDKNRAPELWWNQHRETVASGWQKAELKWDGREEEIDVAILETKFPDQISEYAPLSLCPPAFKQPFESRGFPAVGRKEDDREAVPITGEVIQYVPIDRDVTLGIKFGVKEGRAEEEANDWKGASGSPIIINGRFVAVMANCPIGFGAKRAGAIPFSRLAQNHAFLDAIEFTADLEQLERIRDERRQAVLRELTQLLQGQEQLTDTLLDRLRQQDVDTSEAENKVALEDRAEVLATLLVRVKPKTFLESLCVVTQQGRMSFQRSEVEAIRSIVELVLPVTIDQIDSAVRLAKQKNDSLALQAASRTMAELAIASLENREARFAQPDAKSQDLPLGERCLPPSVLVLPEPGQQTTVDDRATSVDSPPRAEDAGWSETRDAGGGNAIRTARGDQHSPRVFARTS